MRLPSGLGREIHGRAPHVDHRVVDTAAAHGAGAARQARVLVCLLEAPLVLRFQERVRQDPRPLEGNVEDGEVRFPGARQEGALKRRLRAYVLARPSFVTGSSTSPQSSKFK